MTAPFQGFRSEIPDLCGSRPELCGKHRNRRTYELFQATIEHAQQFHNLPQEKWNESRKIQKTRIVVQTSMIPILVVEPFNLERLNKTLGGAMNNKFSKLHPGRILLEDFLAPRGVSVWHLAKDIGVPVRRIYEIVQGQRPINAEIAHRLAHYLGMSERYWLDLQAQHDGKREDKSIKEVPAKQSLRYAG